MAKRYHNSLKHPVQDIERSVRRAKRDVEHEMDYHNDERRHDSMRERWQGVNPMNEYYAGSDARRRQELEDAGMIHEDHRAIANLPQEVRIVAYPKTGPALPSGLDDTISGIDRQMDFDHSQAMRHFFPKKV